MSRITQQLLRKRSQHNDMCLTTLEQISLHQQQLVCIQNLDKLCRHLKILYLQNNIIERMQNLNKLKELQYLNLALNNISCIENIQGCESLKKLDLTVNFIDLFQLHDSVMCLQKLPNLKEIYLTGNPCQQWKGCKDYLIGNIPQLQCYNGEVITPSQRIKAVQNMQNLKRSLYEEIEKLKLKKKCQEKKDAQMKKNMQGMTQEQRNKQKTPYTKEARREIYQQLAADKEKKDREKNPQKYVVQKQSQMYKKDGEIRQCNEGKYKFSLKEYEDPDYSFFELQVPKHINTSDLVVNVNPHWVSVRVKKDLTQIKLNEEIMVNESKTERSQITGFLLIKMKKLQPHEFLRQNKREEEENRKKEAQKKKIEAEQQRAKRLRLCDKYEQKMELIQDEVPDLQ